jgi:hypothetical protein
MSGQRDLMKRLWRDYSGDQSLVIQEYVKAELEGRVARRSNKSSITPEEYANRLMKDGLNNGWLSGKIENKTNPNSDFETSFGGILNKIAPLCSNSNGNQHEKVSWIRSWCENQRIPAESEEYLARIESWRDAWRPKRVRVLLVAESHVREQNGDLAVNVKLPIDLVPDKSSPSGFCRLVYCLGYGEREICFPKDRIKNSGTIQFWDLFGAMAASLNNLIRPEMPRLSESSLFTRLKWKIDVLHTLKNAGVWLEDASVIGIYDSGKRLVYGKSYKLLVRESFMNFVWPKIEKDNPEQIWVIGRGVGNALSGLPMIPPQRIISQPQDRDKSRYLEGVQTLINQIK